MSGIQIIILSAAPATKGVDICCDIPEGTEGVYFVGYLDTGNTRSCGVDLDTEYCIHRSLWYGA